MAPWNDGQAHAPREIPVVHWADAASPLVETATCPAQLPPAPPRKRRSPLLCRDAEGWTKFERQGRLGDLPVRGAPPQKPLHSSCCVHARARASPRCRSETHGWRRKRWRRLQLSGACCGASALHDANPLLAPAAWLEQPACGCCVGEPRHSRLRPRRHLQQLFRCQPCAAAGPPSAWVAADPEGVVPSRQEATQFAAESQEAATDSSFGAACPQVQLVNAARLEARDSDFVVSPQ